MVQIQLLSINNGLQKIAERYSWVHVHCWIPNIFCNLRDNIESSSRYIEDQQSRTTIPFGWDDASSIKIIENVVVNSYNAVCILCKVQTTVINWCMHACLLNACINVWKLGEVGVLAIFTVYFLLIFLQCGSSTMKNRLKPHTVPIITTNHDTCNPK